MSKKWESVIGLEVHLQLSTETKVWCGCSTDYDNSPINTHTCPICLGHPGALPKLNEKVVDYGIKAALALNCKINKESRFDRKNYFYPDLTKGYQVTQFGTTYAEGGFLEIFKDKDKAKKVGITKIQIEEDTGKSIHLQNETLLNYNRASVPLLEIVSEPDMRNADEAYEYLNNLKDVLKYLDISDVSMEHGSLRCDVNVSVMEEGSNEYGTRVEVKNLNSFKAVSRAIEYEIGRQIESIENGEKIDQETRLWSEETQTTKTMRSKEEAMDYRFFPEPDLPRLIIEKVRIEEMEKEMPESKVDKISRFINEYGLSEYDSQILCDNMETALYFEESGRISGNYKLTANWIISELFAVLKEKNLDIENSPVDPKTLGELVELINKKTISSKIGKDVFKKVLESGKSPKEIVEAEGLKQVDDDGAILEMVEEVLKNNSKLVEDYKEADEGRKPRVLKGLIGQVMKISKGKANPQKVTELIKEKID